MILNYPFSIALDPTIDGYVNDDLSTLLALENLSAVNIFVGANNSGKSRMLRKLASLTKVRVKGVGVTPQITQELLRFANAQLSDFGSSGVESTDQLPRAMLEALANPNSYHELGAPPFANEFKTLRQFKDSGYQVGTVTWIDSQKPKSAGGQLDFHKRGAADRAVALLAQLTNTPFVQAPCMVYIPTLRGLRLLDEQHKDFYSGITRENYFVGLHEERPEVFTGLGLYESLIDHLLGHQNERDSIRKFVNFLKSEVFACADLELIPHRDKKTIYVKIGSEAERPIYDLGDGIQNLILLTYIIATRIEPTFFFIEEPETHLHPGMQRNFLSFILSQTNHTFFLTTHSNHLLDMTLDYSRMAVFNFRKELNTVASSIEANMRFIVTQVDGPASSSLALLGVQNSSVFLVNATIWVEGITDRLYYRAMLQALQMSEDPIVKDNRRFEEDLDFGFIEYGGSNVIHWDFSDERLDEVGGLDSLISAKRLCGRAMVIVDGDGGTKAARIHELRTMLGDRLVVLDCKEVENSLSAITIEAVVRDYEGADANLNEFSYEGYKQAYLGTFIDSQVLKGPSNRPRSAKYATESGTIAPKVEFCRRALGRIVWDDLPLETQGLVKKIYQHILEHAKLN